MRGPGDYLLTMLFGYLQLKTIRHCKMQSQWMIYGANGYSAQLAIDKTGVVLMGGANFFNSQVACRIDSDLWSRT